MLTTLGRYALGRMPLGAKRAGTPQPPSSPHLVETELLKWLLSRVPYPAWPGAIHPRSARPAIVLQCFGGAQLATRLGTVRARVGSIRIQVDAWARTVPECEAALETVADALDGYRGPMGPVTVRKARRGNRRGGYDPTGSGSDKGENRRSNEYTIIYQ